jgi:hypothetical protein
MASGDSRAGPGDLADSPQPAASAMSRARTRFVRNGIDPSIPTTNH